MRQSWQLGQHWQLGGRNGRSGKISSKVVSIKRGSSKFVANNYSKRFAMKSETLAAEDLIATFD